MRVVWSNADFRIANIRRRSKKLRLRLLCCPHFNLTTFGQSLRSFPHIVSLSSTRENEKKKDGR